MTKRPAGTDILGSRAVGWGVLAVLHVLALAAIIYAFPTENNWLRDGFDAPRKYLPFLATMTLWPLLLFRLSPAVGWAIALGSALFFHFNDYKQHAPGHISGAAQLIILALLVAVLIWSAPLEAGAASVITLMVAPFGFHFVPPRWNLDNTEGWGSGVPGICWAIAVGLVLRWLLAYLRQTGADSEINRVAIVLHSDWSRLKVQVRAVVPAPIARRLAGSRWLTILIVACFGWQLADWWHQLDEIRRHIIYVETEVASHRYEYLHYSRPAQFGWALALTTPLLLIRRHVVLGWVLAVVAELAFFATFSGWHRFHGEYIEGLENTPLAYVVILALLCMVVVRADFPMAAVAALVTVLLFFSKAPDSVALVIVVVALAGVVRWSALSGKRLAAAEADAEQERTRRELLEERAHLARELHDVVAHHMSLVVVQAQTAPYRLERLDDLARAEFDSIAAASRQALNEIRGLLGVLRSDGDSAELAPQPAAADVVDLLEAARNAGVDVTWTVDGDPTAVGEATGLALFRIVQESLANTARHAAGAPVTVALSFGAETVVRVTNETPGSVADTVAGHGITGMRERAAAVRGCLTAGPDAEGGYTVAARLPAGVAAVA